MGLYRVKGQECIVVSVGCSDSRGYYGNNEGI